MNHKYESTANLPKNEPDTKGKSPKIWELAESDDFKSLLLMHVVEDIRACSPEVMSAAACRAALSRLKAYVNMYDIGPRFARFQEEQNNNEELRAII